jgi:ComEC/Rec2-related protein
MGGGRRRAWRSCCGCGLLAGAGLPSRRRHARALLRRFALGSRGAGRIASARSRCCSPWRWPRGAARARARRSSASARAPGDDAVARIEGRITEPPLREAAEPLAVVAVERRARRSSRHPHPARASRPGDRSEWGDRVSALARCRHAVRRRAIPGGFDARAAGRRRGARRQRACPRRALRRPRAGSTRGRARPSRACGAGSSAGSPRISRPPARELIVPLGDRRPLGASARAQRELKASGLVHLLALSGLHVAWLAALARGMCASLGGGPGGAAATAGCARCSTSGSQGPIPSLARATATELAIAGARLIDRALDPIQGLALSVLALLVLAPPWALDLGFQLSCAATVGLVTIGPWLAARCGRMRPALMPFVPTDIAQITAMPLLLLRFHALSWVGAFANLAAVPVCGLCSRPLGSQRSRKPVLPGTARAWFGACEGCPRCSQA